jgi:hypothetical protein
MPHQWNSLSLRSNLSTVRSKLIQAVQGLYVCMSLRWISSAHTWIYQKKERKNIRNNGFLPALQQARPKDTGESSTAKAIPVTCRGGLWCCQMLKIPHCLDSRLTDGGKVVSPTHRLRSTTQKHYFFCFWYSFLLEADWTPGPSSAEKVG